MLNEKIKIKKMFIIITYVCFRNLIFITIAFDDISKLIILRNFLIEFDVFYWENASGRYFITRPNGLKGSKLGS